MASLRNFIESDPNAEFPAEKGRYHLYVSLACPFACRVTAAINLKGLQDYVDVTVVHPVFQRTRPEDPNDTHTGWTFVDPATTPFTTGPTGLGQYASTRCSPDPIHNAKYVRDLYERVIDGKSGVRFSVPLLWDKKKDTIVSTESADMVRMVNTAFEGIAPSKIDLYPEHLRAEIDAVNEWVTDSINNGVYKVGFAQKQDAYDTAIAALYAGLDRVEALLAKQRYLVGNTFTEADIRLFVTLIRFDEVYVVQFKCNKKMIKDYPNILNYLRDIYQTPGIKETVDFDHIKMSYFASQLNLNPFGIIPVGPGIDYTVAHGRDRFQ